VPGEVVAGVAVAVPPEPERRTEIAVLEMLRFLLPRKIGDQISETFPFTVPMACGVKVTPKLMLCPAFRVRGRPGTFRLNPDPVTAA
jgi:hypothetical protein